MKKVDAEIEEEAVPAPAKKKPNVKVRLSPSGERAEEVKEVVVTPDEIEKELNVLPSKNIQISDEDVEDLLKGLEDDVPTEAEIEEEEVDEEEVDEE